MNKIKRLSDILNESIQDKLNITIEPVIEDERGNRRGGEITYSVNYQNEVDGTLIEFEGTLEPYDSGRDIDYEFEVGYFTDKVSEEYVDNNWEDIEEEIFKKFNS